jgi:hypothetical protein
VLKHNSAVHSNESFFRQRSNRGFFVLRCILTQLVNFGMMTLAFLGLLVLIAVWLDRTNGARSHGETNLTVEFVVTDAATGRPLKGAEIVATNPEDQKQQPVRWTTDREGLAIWQGRAGWNGEESGLLFTNTRAVNKPFWLLHVSAPGYLQPEPTWLHEMGVPKRLWVVSIGSGQDKLVVPIGLRRAAP